MPFRKILYWPHLICGVIAGLVILSMSVTGVLLTYEKQMISWSESDMNVSVAGPERMPMDEVISKASKAKDEVKIRSVVIKSDPLAPIMIEYSDRRRLYFNPYNGENLGDGPAGMRSFFKTVTALHRWFDLKGANRNTGRMITGAANLMFLFLVISGIYLWFPQIMRWANFKKILMFRKTNSGHARDFNWHHVMGIWSVIPLIVITSTATVFYYKWANDLVYEIADGPKVKQSSKARKPASNKIENKTIALSADMPASLSAMVATATQQKQDWRSLSFRLPKPKAKTVSFTVATGWGGEPTKKTSVAINRASGDVVSVKSFDDNTAGRQARIYIRFLHTGEALGLLGQTIAGIVSLFSAIMVWTGLALAWRKYIRPMLKK